MKDQTESATLKAPLLCAGDSVLIHKPATIDWQHQFGWITDMDEHDGWVSSVRRVLPKQEDEIIQAYDLDIDGGEFGWLETWLTKLDA